MELSVAFSLKKQKKSGKKTKKTLAIAAFVW